MVLERSEKFIFVWKINNFSSVSKVTGKAIDSPVFKTKKFDRSQWYMKLYPLGDVRENDNCTSIFLCKKMQTISAEANVRIAVEIEFIAGDKESIATATTHESFYNENIKLGYSRFVSTSTVFEKMKKVEEKYLTIRCRVFFYFPINPPEYVFHSDAYVDKISFLWNLITPNAESEIVSKQFFFSRNPLYEITLCIPDDEVEICIRQKDDGRIHSRFITCNLSLLSSNGDPLRSMKGDHLFGTNAQKDHWNFPTFFTKTFLETNQHDLFKKDEISVLCELTSSTVLSYCDKNVSNADAPCSILQEDMENMFLKRIHADIKLKTNGEIVHAHKSILAARSPVFRAMFDQDMRESHSGIVEIVDVETSSLKAFLEFLYTGKMQKSGFEETKKLLLVADKYQVPTLKEECASFLKSIFSVDHVCELLSLAEMIGHEELKAISVDFICKNYSIILNSPVWADLIEQNVKLASEVFAHITTNFKMVSKT